MSATSVTARSWRGRSGVVALAVAVATTLGAAGGCDKQSSDGASTDDTATAPTLGFDSPSKAELADATGLAFPASVTDYQSVQLGPGQLDVMFTLPAGDVDAFIADSKLAPLTDDARVIAHPSPLWELNPDEPLAGTSVTRDGMSINVEIIGASDPRTARVAVIATDPGAGSGSESGSE